MANAAARAENREREAWRRRFFRLMEGFRFLPGGRILAGAGSPHKVTLFNCFVMGGIGDSLGEIFDHLKEGALTLQQGGGIGYDFSTLRPAGTPAKTSGMFASGPVSFMRVWDAMCATMQSTGSRRGAMMATLRCDHPDIEAFIDAKRSPGALRYFNLSVQVTDAFLEAVEKDREWPLRFPDKDEAADSIRAAAHRAGRIYKKVRARHLWEHLLQSALETAEPGVLFVDTINRENNLAYRERITATNPCGEIPLPSYGACDLGSLNLTRFVRESFAENAGLDLDAVAETAAGAVRLLDNVIDISGFPLAQQAEQARRTRRIGLGVTGLADALVMLGLRYESERGRETVASALRALRDAAYRTSVDLAREKGAFPAFEREAYLESPFIRRLPDDIRRGMRKYGIRNSHLVAIAPTGTISLLAGSVSSGVEPIYARRYSRRVLTDGMPDTFEVEDYAYRLWRTMQPKDVLPPAFVTANEVSATAQVEMLGVLQPYVDNAISKTIYLCKSIKTSELEFLFEKSNQIGLKGLTVFRPDGLRGGILSCRRNTVDHDCAPS